MLVGVEPGSPEEREAHEIMERYGAGVRNLVALPFLEDRDQLLAHLRRASVAVFPSWYDGFGLAAWEAVGAGVPLIISRNCGAFQLIEESLGGMGRGGLSCVDVSGRARDPGGKLSEVFATSDVENVSNALLEFAAHENEKRQDAIRLRSQLLAYGCTWEFCARQFAKAMSLPCRPVRRRGR
jgi:glycosyltransferase involved in cell wall biosynthesis